METRWKKTAAFGEILVCVFIYYNLLWALCLWKCSDSVCVLCLFSLRCWQSHAALWEDHVFCCRSVSMASSCPSALFQPVVYFSASLCCCHHSCPTPHATMSIVFGVLFLPGPPGLQEIQPCDFNILVRAHTLSEGHVWMENAWSVLLCVENSSSFDSTQSEVRKVTDSFSFMAATRRTRWLMWMSAFLIDKVTHRWGKPVASRKLHLTVVTCPEVVRF